MSETMRSKEQNRMLWYLIGRAGLDREAVATMVSGWTDGRTEHTSALTFCEARDLIQRLEESLRMPKGQKSGDGDKLDKLRKGVLKSIFAWFELRGKKVGVAYVKSVACRAAGGKAAFDLLTEGDLRRIYAEFCKKQSVAREKNDLNQ